MTELAATPRTNAPSPPSTSAKPNSRGRVTVIWMLRGRAPRVARRS
ncbi:hypothetical protein [Microbacterium sp. K2]